jgi:uncharacterized membrane protein YjjP (DUF1212 family)
MNYHKLLQAILDIAEEMLACGAEVARVEDSIERMCSAYGCTRINAFIITSNIQVTFVSPDDEIITQIRRLVRNNVNLDRLDYLNDLSRYICSNRPSLEELTKKYDDVMNRRQPSPWFEYFGAMIVASSFALFFGGSVFDGVFAAIVGAVINFVKKRLSKYEKNDLALVFITSMVAGFVSLIPSILSIGVNTDTIMIGGIMLLIPGIALTNSIRDMLTGDIGSGLLRFADALLMALVIACGFALPLLFLGGVFL